MKQVRFFREDSGRIQVNASVYRSMCIYIYIYKYFGAKAIHHILEKYVICMENKNVIQTFGFLAMCHGAQVNMVG